MMQSDLTPDMIQAALTAPGADASGLTDSSAAIQAAIDRYSNVVLAPGRYLITTPLTLSTNQRLIGSGEGLTTLAPAGDMDLIRFAGSNVETAGYSVDNSNRTGGTDFVIDTGSGANLTGIRIHDIYCEQSYQALSDLGTGIYVQLRMDRVKHLRHRGPGYVMRRGFSFLYIDFSNTLEFTNSVSPNFIGFDFDGATLSGPAGGLYLGLNLAGSAGEAGTTSAQNGFVIQHAAEIHFERCRADTLGGDGLLLNACNNVYFSDSPFYGLCGGMQVRIRDSIYVEGSGFTVRGRGTIGGAASQHGVSFEGGTSEISLARISARENTGDGINFNGTGSNIQIGAISARSNIGNGVQKQGGGRGTTEIGNLMAIANGARGLLTDDAGAFGVKGGLLNANVGGNLELGSDLHVARSMTIESGACGDYTGPVTA
ncbi:glycosyl hydrolase family 28-related protein [Sphingomonas sp. PAMC 26605]|uniref:glycosyl hydrolase family 28-related protein n=1 Tax=Sphingomonas sp. PAMC 26605 TaxID=1112214 RepID=UPI0009DB0B63|nr:glycosyl hydrolase family 28-related protein [Sphingomonas sp. PAMC 26605]